ncbi:MAG: hypothetical protein IH995_07895 [Proteobacteria bacterium]|nr:hypothetical protein [Pseudomonadota bacterium]
MKKFGLLILIVASNLITVEVHSSTIIGRWCDEMIPSMPQYNGVLSIVISNDGIPLLLSSYNDGSSRENKLREIPGGIYEQIGSATGDKYRIAPSSGNLQLIDNDGLIRTAKRLENSPQLREC